MALEYKGFNLVDFILFGSVLGISFIIGLYPAFFGGRQKTVTEFHLANKKMSSFPIAMSLLMSFASAIMVLGQPAEMYTKGTLFAMRIFGYCAACFLASVTFVPLFYSLKSVSSFEVRRQFLLTSSV
jgi:Na+/proline symporter